YDSIIFPKKITITSPETKKGSAIFFTRVTALDTIDPLDFVLRVPPGTKEIFLDEKDPRFQFSKAPSTAQAPTPSVKVMPVYLAKPLKKPAEKMAPAPVQEVKDTPKTPEPAVAPKKEASQDAPEKTPAAAIAPENADADIAVEAPSPAVPASASDAQTTLDPSVAASLDMEKQ
ncbi:MAG: hypothetical protein PHV97_06775, partial [Candidatus Omnitrophica bacterium]|nr:hypothetical protein [Candidatus Omnitrophota bacterium]